VEFRPVDVQASDWDCTLEPAAGAFGFAIRMGFRYVKGMRRPEAETIIGKRPFRSLSDLKLRTALNAGTRERLATADAFASLDHDRREALWEVAAGAQTTPLPLHTREEAPAFKPLSDFEEVSWDFRAGAHSTRDHPLGPLREVLTRLGLPDAAKVNAMRNGRRVRYAGVVICRQRPGTAGGVTFMTLEDETGFVNLVLWKQVFERNALIAKTESFLGASGKIQREDGVTHLIVDELWRPDLSSQPVRSRSRDFH